MRHVRTFQNHTFLDHRLGPSSVVFDLGSNMGAFAADIIRAYRCRCIAFEPNPDCHSKIPELPRLEKVLAAVGAFDGESAFLIHENPEASRLTRLSEEESTRVRVIKLETIAVRYGVEAIDLVKMDIEGSEVDVLDSLSDSFLLSVEQLSIEFHDFAGYTSVHDIFRLKRRLEALGFVWLRFSRNGYANTLLVNNRRLELTFTQLAFLRFIVRNGLGVKRLASRLLARYLGNGRARHD